MFKFGTDKTTTGGRSRGATGRPYTPSLSPRWGMRGAKVDWPVVAAPKFAGLHPATPLFYELGVFRLDWVIYPDRSSRGRGRVQDVSKEEAERIIDEGKIVVVDFYADWCIPCKMLAPVFEEVAAKCKEAEFLKVNVDKSGSWPDELRIKAIPTILFFKNGKLYEERLIGYNPKVGEKIIEIVKRLKSEGNSHISLRNFSKLRNHSDGSSKESIQTVYGSGYEVFRKAGVGPFILGKLAGAVKNAEFARKLLKETPWWRWWDRQYYRHVINEGERAKKILDKYLKQIQEVKHELERRE